METQQYTITDTCTITRNHHILHQQSCNNFSSIESNRLLRLLSIERIHRSIHNHSSIYRGRGDRRKRTPTVCTGSTVIVFNNRRIASTNIRKGEFNSVRLSTSLLCNNSTVSVATNSMTKRLVSSHRIERRSRSRRTRRRTKKNHAHHLYLNIKIIVIAYGYYERTTTGWARKYSS